LPGRRIYAATMGQYSEIVMDHFRSPRNFGLLDEPSAVGVASLGGRPPTVLLHLRIEDARIVRAAFQTFSCGATIDAASVLSELITGRAVSDCLAITEQDLIRALGGLPPGKEHSAKIAIAALKDALRKLPSAG